MGVGEILKPIIRSNHFSWIRNNLEVVGENRASNGSKVWYWTSWNISIERKTKWYFWSLLKTISTKSQICRLTKKSVLRYSQPCGTHTEHQKIKSRGKTSLFRERKPQGDHLVTSTVGFALLPLTHPLEEAELTLNEEQTMETQNKASNAFSIHNTRQRFLENTEVMIKQRLVRKFTGRGSHSRGANTFLSAVEPGWLEHPDAGLWGQQFGLVDVGNITFTWSRRHSCQKSGVKWYTRSSNNRNSKSWESAPQKTSQTIES